MHVMTRCTARTRIRVKEQEQPWIRALGSASAEVDGNGSVAVRIQEIEERVQVVETQVERAVGRAAASRSGGCVHFVRAAGCAPHEREEPVGAGTCYNILMCGLVGPIWEHLCRCPP